MNQAENEELQKVVDEWKEDWGRNIKIMEKMFSAIKKVGDAFYCARSGSRLPYTPHDLVVKELCDVISGLLDSTPEAKRERQLKALEQSIRRKRKLSAEDMLKIYESHAEKKASFRSIAKKFNVSEWTIRKTFQRVESVLCNVNNGEWSRINYEGR